VFEETNASDLITALAIWLGRPVRDVESLPVPELQRLVAQLTKHQSGLLSTYSTGAESDQRRVARRRRDNERMRSAEGAGNDQTSGKQLGRFKEECLKDEEFQECANRVVPLKNGGSINAELGLILLSSLRTLLAQEPEHFRTLLAMARGNKTDIDEESITLLHYHSFLDDHHHLLPGLRDVLLAAYQETKEGPVLGNPFQFKDEREAKALEAVDEQRKIRFLRDVLAKLDKADEKDEGHSL
jgi:hypothetical protein